MSSKSKLAKEVIEGGSKAARKAVSKATRESTQAVAKASRRKAKDLGKAYRKGGKKAARKIIGGTTVAGTIGGSLLSSLSSVFGTSSQDPNKAALELAAKRQADLNREKEREAREKSAKAEKEESETLTKIQISKNSIKSLKQEIEKYEKKLNNINSEIKETLEERVKNTDGINKATDELNVLKSTGSKDEESRRRISDLSASISSLSLKNDRLKNYVDLLQAEESDLKDYVDKLRIELTTRENKTNSLEKELKENDSKTVAEIVDALHKGEAKAMSTLDKVLSGLMFMPLAIEAIGDLVTTGFNSIWNNISEGFSDIFGVLGDEEGDNRTEEEKLEDEVKEAKSDQTWALAGGAADVAANAAEFALAKGGQKVAAKTAAKTAGKKVASKTVGKTAAKTIDKKVASKTATKTAVKEVAKVAGKTAGKSLVKKIPVVGLLAGLGMGAYRGLKEGDWAGAGLEVLSGATSLLNLIPGVGPALGLGAGLAVDSAIAARDYKIAKDKELAAQTSLDAMNNSETNQSIKEIQRLSSMSPEKIREQLGTGSLTADELRALGLGENVISNIDGVDRINTDANSLVNAIYSGNTDMDIDQSKKNSELYFVKFIGLYRILQTVKNVIPNINIVDNWDQDVAVTKLRALPLSGALYNQGNFLINLQGERYYDLVKEYFTSASSLLNTIDHSLGASMDTLFGVINNAIGDRKYRGVLNSININLSSYSDEKLRQIKELLAKRVAVVNNLDLAALGVELLGEDIYGNKSGYSNINFNRVVVSGNKATWSNMAGVRQAGTLANQRNGAVIMRYLMDTYGLTDYQAAGLAGNLYAESGWKPGAYNKGEKNGTGTAGQNKDLVKGLSSTGGYGAGIAQWTAGRKKPLLDNYNKRHGTNYTRIEDVDLAGQLEMLDYELNNNKKGFLELLRKAKDLEEATDVSLRGFENGGNGTLASKEFMDKYTWAGGYQGAMYGDKNRVGRLSYAQRSLEILNAQEGGSEVSANNDGSVVRSTSEKSEKSGYTVSQQVPQGTPRENSKSSDIDGKLDALLELGTRTFVQTSMPNYIPVPVQQDQLTPKGLGPLRNNENLE